MSKALLRLKQEIAESRQEAGAQEAPAFQIAQNLPSYQDLIDPNIPLDIESVEPTEPARDPRGSLGTPLREGVARAIAEPPSGIARVAGQAIDVASRLGTVLDPRKLSRGDLEQQNIQSAALAQTVGALEGIEGILND